MTVQRTIELSSAPSSSEGEHGRAEKALVNAARALTASLDVNGVCQAVLDAVEQLFDARSAWILLHDAGSRQLRTAGTRGRGSEPFRDVVVPSDVGILGRAFTERKAIFVPEAHEEDRWFDAARVRAAPLQSVLTVPLARGDESLGVLGLESPRFTAAHPPDETQIGRLEALAAQAAIAVANARLYSASEEDRRRLRTLLEEQRRLRTHVTHLEQEIRIAGAFNDIVGQSRALMEVLEQAALAAPGDTTILLLGETGSGKELLARLIHDRSGRPRGPFVAVNCAALPEALVESELFGHEKGAFTGALARKPGKFEIAHRGTLFLDEIADLPAEAQAKLLRVLQDGRVQRVGSVQPIQVDARVVAATNQDLERAVGSKRFRSDLFYRLSVFPIRIPPLRERREDIPLLAKHFAKHFASKLRKTIDEIAPAALQLLSEYEWPGNIRELQNVIERAVVLTRDRTIGPDAIGVRGGTPSEAQPSAPDVVPLVQAERRAIIAALVAARWRVSGEAGAAALLQLKPTTLHAKMKKLGIHRPK